MSAVEHFSMLFHCVMVVVLGGPLNVVLLTCVSPISMLTVQSLYLRAADCVGW